MNKALLVGGNNGIGLSIGFQFLNMGYSLIVVDKDKKSNYSDSNVEYIETDLLYFDKDLFEKLAADESIKCLVITAGIGRVSHFEFLNLGEIKNIISLNTVAAIEIIRIFFNRIKSSTPFYTAVMVSIAGHVSSPLFSVYSASKSALASFIESVNIEIEVDGYENRILDVSPGSIKGTRFYGGENDISLTASLANNIICELYKRKQLFIPQFKEVFERVLLDYKNDPHAFGIHSYDYKIKSNRVNEKNRGTIGYLSGTFDLFHIGHLNLLRKAKGQCDYLIVGVHASGSWKGKETYIPFDDRKEIVAGCKYVDEVVDAYDEDSDAWFRYGYTKLFVGSDYKGTDRFLKYERYFKDKNVQIIYFPYTKGISSTQLRNKIKNIKTE